MLNQYLSSRGLFRAQESKQQVFCPEMSVIQGLASSAA